MFVYALNFSLCTILSYSLVYLNNGWSSYYLSSETDPIHTTFVFLYFLMCYSIVFGEVIGIVRRPGEFHCIITCFMYFCCI